MAAKSWEEVGGGTGVRKKKREKEENTKVIKKKTKRRKIPAATLPHFPVQFRSIADEFIVQFCF
jgi:hypothetical protein